MRYKQTFFLIKTQHKNYKPELFSQIEAFIDNSRTLSFIFLFKARGSAGVDQISAEM